MAVVTFSRNIAFPMGALREMLAKHFPIHTWLCGEEDRGEARQMGEFRPHCIISGRSPTMVIFTELRACAGTYSEPSPPHLWHLLVGDPTTEQREIADQVTIIICATLMVEDQGDARCQLVPGGNWLDGHDLLRLLKLVVSGESLDVAAGLGIPASQFVRPSTPRPDHLGSGALPGPGPADSSAQGAQPTLMSIVALTKPVGFPVSIMREQLNSNFPGFIWKCGDLDRGMPGDTTNLREPQVITGTNGSVNLFVLVEGRVETLPGQIWCPPHRVHVRVHVDTGGDMALARLLSLVVCCCLVICQDDKAHFQLSPDGNWLSHDDAMTGVSLPRHVSDVGDFDRVFGTKPSEFAGKYPYLEGAADPSVDDFASRYRAQDINAGKPSGESLGDASSPSVGVSAIARDGPAPQPGFGRRAVGGFGRKRV